MPKKRSPVKMGGVSARVPEPVLKEIKHIVFTEGYNNVADYLRELIREDFKKRGIKFKKKSMERLKKTEEKKLEENERGVNIA